MGVSLSSSVAIGVKLSRDDLWPIVTIPSCTHSPPAKSKFCPECGEKTSGKKVRSNPHNIPGPDDYLEPKGFTVISAQLDSDNGEPCFVDEDGEEGERCWAKHVIIAVHHADTPYEEAWAKISIGDDVRMADLKDELREILGSELFDKGEFGVWGICTSGW